MECPIKVSDLDSYFIEKNTVPDIISIDIYDNTWFYFYGYIYAFDLDGFIYCKHKSWAVVGTWDFKSNCPIWNKHFNPLL